MENQEDKRTSLTRGSIMKGLAAFTLPLFLGQLLQQLYNMADAWVVGNFADNNAFAAVSLAGNISFLIIGFFSGIAVGISGQRIKPEWNGLSILILCLEFLLL